MRAALPPGAAPSRLAGAAGVVFLFGLLGLLLKARPVLAWLCRNRRFEGDRVNLGSGLEGSAGWINVDGGLSAMIGRLPARLLRQIHTCTPYGKQMSAGEYIGRLRSLAFHDLRYGIPMGDSTARYVFTSHFLEHLYRDDAKDLMREAYRVLRPGGHIRVAVPDLRRALELYRNGDKERALKFFFVDRGEAILQHHRWMYDAELLCELLESVGFKGARQQAFRQGMVPDLDQLDNRPTKTVFVEAVKPGGCDVTALPRRR